VYIALYEAAQEVGVDFWLLAAVTYQESAWNYLALGDRDKDGVPHAFGLGQLNDGGAGKGYPKEVLLTPDANALISAGNLKYCLSAFPGDDKSGIAAYRQGVKGVKDNGWEVSKGYVLEIISNWDRWRLALPLQRGLTAR
jgi:hypothetical protein